MAEAITNHMALERKLDVHAWSAGTVGGKLVNPQAIAVLDEIGISLAGHEPKLICTELIWKSNKIISMGCGVDAETCPTKFLLTEDWELDDPAGQPIETVRAIRDQIIKRITTLLDAFEGEKA